jgi:hypothetical protein
MVKLRAHHGQWGEIVDDIDSIGDGGFRFSDPGLGSGAVISTGVYVLGVHGGLPSAVQMDLLGQLVESFCSASTANAWAQWGVWRFSIASIPILRNGRSLFQGRANTKDRRNNR